jgi:putative Holliday junction resolvase
LAWQWTEVAANAIRLLGLDVGDRRIGVAVSDPTGSLATPVEVYHRRDRASDVRHMVRLARDLEVSGIIVGLPKNMNGTEGPQAEKTRDFVASLVEAGLVVSLWDERLSTVEATRRLVEAGRKGKSIRQRIDSEAAALILESYLDYVRMKGTS